MDDVESTNRNLQHQYFKSVERADGRGLESVLIRKSQFNINATNASGKTALRLAIERKSTDIIKILLHHGVDIGVALFHAIDAKFTKAIELILDSPQGKEVIDAHAGNQSEEFHPDTTPLILAAHHNDYNVIKLLIRRGATPIAVTNHQTENHTIQRSIGTLNIYKALASEAYMSAIETETEHNPDPFRRAFELCHELRRESSKEYEFREQYLELAAKCEQYTADLLGQTHDSAELKTILGHDSDMSAKSIGKEARPMKVLYAVKREQRKFIVHPHCQQHLIEMWYRGLANWRDSSWIRNVIISTLIMLAFPVLGLFYVIFPFGKFGKFMRIPYVKFLMHTSSYIVFLTLLFLSTQHIGNHEIRGENQKQNLELQQKLSQQRGSAPTNIEWLIIIWVIGVTWREMRELWNAGCSEYVANAWNVMDLLQIVLYWIWIGIRLAAYIMVYKEKLGYVDVEEREVSDYPFNSSIPATGYIYDDSPDFENPPGAANETELSSFGDSFPQEDAMMSYYLEGRLNEILGAVAELTDRIESSPQYEAAITKMSLELSRIALLLTRLNATDDSDSYPDSSFSFDDWQYSDFSYKVPRKEWDQTDPTLLADCVIAVANVVSVIRFLRVMVVNEYVGPLQISVGKMIKDILKFMFIFSLVWMAFALGLTQIYWGYSPDELLECMGEEHTSYKECYGKLFFADIGTSSKTLFWSLYGLIDLDALEVKADHMSTEFFGELLFGTYQIVAVIILLNLLIALMGTTYDSIAQNADIEWKFHRSEMWMEYFRRGTTEAPPFNVLPNTRVIMNAFRRLFHCVSCQKDKKRQELMKRRSDSVKESQNDYEKLCRQLILRYFADKHTSQNDSCEEEVASKSDLSTVRFEICDIIQRLEGTFSQFRDELNGKLNTIDENQLKELAAVEDMKGQLKEIQGEKI